MKTHAFLIRILICFLLSLIPLRELESRIFSKRVEFRGKQNESTNIVILEVTPQDFKILKSRYSRNVDSRGEPWKSESESAPATSKADRYAGLRDVYFWDPNVFRETFQILLGHNPAAVAVTWYIPNEVIDSLSDPGIEILSRNPKIVWSSQFDSEGNYRRVSRLLSTQAGFNNVTIGLDGTVQHASFYRKKRYSLSWVTSSLVKAPGEMPAPIQQLGEEPILMNYLGPSGTFPTCRLIDINRKSACTDLAGKILLISRQEKSRSQDEALNTTTFRTPLGEMSRAELIANEIHMLVAPKFFHSISMVAQAAIMLLMISLTAFYIIYYPVMQSVLAITGTGLFVILGVIQILFQLNIYIPTANIGASVLISYLVFTGYRQAFQENQQWRALKQAQFSKELEQMKSNFLSLVSHDLKTPVAKIQAVVERIRRESKLSEDQQTPLIEHLESIENSNNELKRYISSVLNLSRIESQKVILNKKSNDINRIIEQVVKRLRSLAQPKNITFEQNLEPLFSVECDEDLIRQVLTNLVDNAIKYSPQDSKIIVRSKEEDGFVRVDVEDFGPGIPQDQLPLMFQKYNRFMKPLHEQVKGTGLGLYLSKYFIELHGGSIRLKSQVGKGTVFTFTLPLTGGESESLLS